jgi:prevent-host-death family protein
MERIGVRELRQNASVYLARVKAGETLEVTDRGKVVALLTPSNGRNDLLDQWIAEGKIIPPERPFKLPKLRSLPEGSPSTAEILDQLREERLP